MVLRPINIVFAIANKYLAAVKHEISNTQLRNKCCRNPDKRIVALPLYSRTTPNLPWKQVRHGDRAWGVPSSHGISSTFAPFLRSSNAISGRSQLRVRDKAIVLSSPFSHLDRLVADDMTDQCMAALDGHLLNLLVKQLVLLGRLTRIDFLSPIRPV